MVWTYSHYANCDGIPLWWDLGINTWTWALPLSIKIRPWLVDGSGRKEYVANVKVRLFCLYWDACYAWGKKRYRPAPVPVLSLRQVMERDRAWDRTAAKFLTEEPDDPHNDA
jgi:hypothetical protein